MRRIFPLVLLLNALVSGVLAQEAPVVVQTLTFDSLTARRGVFTFPDGTQPWRKILMLHTLKCDPATTADGYDCGEWDYLTYTRVYHHTGEQDSTVLDHPHYLAGLLAPDTIALSTVPLFDRQVIGTKAVDLLQTDPVPESEIQVLQPEPLVLPAGSSRIQMVLTAGELAAAGMSPGPIDQMIWHPAESGITGLLTIRMSDMAADTLDGPKGGSLTEVYRHRIHTQGPDTLTFFQPFVWEGVNGLLIDLSLDGTDADLSLDAGDMVLHRSIAALGTDGYLDLRGDGWLEPDPAPLAQLGQEITIAFWAKGGSEQPQNHSILEATDAQGRRVLNIHLPWSNGQIYWDAGDGPNYDRINKAADAADYKDNWTHWTFTKNAGTGSMKIYRNGQLWHSGNGFTLPIQTATRLVFGRALTYDGPYRGQIDELQIFRKELDAATIATLPGRVIRNGDAAYPDLIYTYGFDRQEALLTSRDAIGSTARVFGRQNWQARDARDLAMVVPAPRPRLGFRQANAQIQVAMDTLHQLMPRPLTGVAEYGIQGHTPVLTGTLHGWVAGTTRLLAPDGSVLDSMPGPADEVLVNSTLQYFSEPFEVVDEYEIGRFITPYGIGLDLGAGFTWVYDVTDYANILKDQVELSAGNNQELIDLKFLFYPGTPAREVKRIDRLWGGLKSYSYKNLDDDVALPPITVDLLPEAESWKVKTRITGHGHNSNDGSYPHCCEWKDNTHTLLVNNSKMADWHVWQTHDCALNPVYPQGGTWPGAREGWCPGDKVKEHEFEITDWVTGPTVDLDYRITPVPANNAGMGGGNYVMDMQLLQYGPWAFDTDAEIYEIIAPSLDGYSSRLNPVCHDPQIVLRNGGSMPLTSVTFSYGVSGGTAETWTWTGSLDPMEKAVVSLPVPSSAFWVGDGSDQFNIDILGANGQADPNEENNHLTSAFALPKDYKAGIRFRLRTNNYPSESSVTIRDAAGNVVFQQSGFEANKQYDFKMNYPDGCYTFELLDAADDGLSYWADPDAGVGYLRILAPTIDAVLKYFESEFGRSIRYSFILGDLTGTEDPVLPGAQVRIGPNPVVDHLDLDIQGRTGPGQLLVVDLFGRTVWERTVGFPFSGMVDLPDLTPGLYTVQVSQPGWSFRQKLVVGRP